ncbi:MAG: ParB N-terminal domain-containing protein [Ignavibacteriales bacterium]|nr:ParB N-terminal domain-containing protein [Ignavibacteriales bacterium]
MEPITIPKFREIIDDFAEEIKRRKTKVSPPKTVIYFRNEHIKGIERDVWEVPVELLRYRVDNGRISSDVESYRKMYGPLLERDENTQKILASFLERKDPDLTEILVKSIKHTGQKEPAIITCDGFLINGNRRKLALEKLKLPTMRVVILPGPGDEGGQPTLLEIEQIENRYQLQKEGKAEYYKFDRAISIRRKEKLGMSLEMQLRDDPQFASLPEKEFQQKMQEYQREYLEPLKCIDMYLSHIGREGLYDNISTAIADREGRWQAFYDYSDSVESKLNDEKKRINLLKVGEDEVGIVRDVAFKIIRQREFPKLKKVHQIMRDFPKMLRRSESKEALFELKDINMDLPNKLKYDENGEELDFKKIDQMWISNNAQTIIRQVKKAINLDEYEREKETPVLLLQAAFEKLNHPKMLPRNAKVEECKDACILAQQIRDRADILRAEFASLDKMSKKFKVKNQMKKKHK